LAQQLVEPAQHSHVLMRAGAVLALGDPHGVGGRVRDQQAADVPERDQQDSEVEQWAAQSQLPVLVELAPARRAAEPVVAVTPQVTTDEASDRRRTDG
jgi:hypothetical protein